MAKDVFKKSFILFSILFTMHALNAQDFKNAPYKNSELSVDERVENLISLITYMKNRTLK